MTAELQRLVVPVTPFQQNCSIVWCARTGKGAVVDPGGDLDRIAARVAAAGVTLEKVLLTHAHLDHAAGARNFADRYGIPIEAQITVFTKQIRELEVMIGFEEKRHRDIFVGQMPFSALKNTIIR